MSSHTARSNCSAADDVGLASIIQQQTAAFVLVYPFTWSAGTNNSVQADHIKSVPIDTPWHETAKRQHSLKVERQMFETEEEAQIKIDMTKPS